MPMRPAGAMLASDRKSNEVTKVTEKVTDVTEKRIIELLRLYKCFPEIFHSLSGKSHRVLSWTHYRCLMRTITRHWA